MPHVLFVGLAMLLTARLAEAAVWHTDFGEAQRRAYGENRIVLIHFMSSDRGGIYDRLQKEVFSTYEFQTFADRHLVLIEVDFPRWKQLHPTQIKINRELADKYGGHAWPIVVLVNNRGEVLGRLRYTEGGPERFIKQVEQMANLTAAPVPPPAAPAPLFSGAPTGPAPQYKDLVLKSISGTGTKRLALINNVTLSAGEVGKVRLGAGEVKVRCDEIRDDAVLVTVENKGKRELRLFPTQAAAGQQGATKPVLSK